MAGSLTLTVAVSAITSTVVSGLGFVVGVRIAKDQGDRGALREIYRRLFEHFRGLRDAIENKRPKAWPDFPLEENKYVPPFSKMIRSGEASLLPPALAQSCEQAEADALIAGSKFQIWARDVYGPALRELISLQAKGTEKAIERRSYREVRVGAFALYSQDDLSELLDVIRKNSWGVGFQFATDRGRTDSVYVYPEYVSTGDPSGLLTEGWELANTQEGNDRRGDLRNVSRRLSTLTTTLSARIADPHPLLESISRSITDVCRGR